METNKQTNNPKLIPVCLLSYIASYGKSGRRGLENGLLGNTFGRKRENITREWRKLHSKELRDIYSLPIIRVIKSKMMRWARHEARMGETEMHGEFRTKS
jgi:hypothetical protein